jgi:hypothetical protein
MISTTQRLNSWGWHLSGYRRFAPGNTSLDDYDGGRMLQSQDLIVEDGRLTVTAEEQGATFLLNGWFVILLRFVPEKLGALFTSYFYSLSGL